MTRRRHSIFFRLILTLGLALLAVNGLLWLFQRLTWGQSMRTRAQAMAWDYVERLAADLGPKPSPERLAQVLGPSGLDLRARIGNKEYASRPELPNIEDSLKACGIQKGLQSGAPGSSRSYGWRRGLFLGVLHKGKDLYVFSLPLHAAAAPWGLAVAGLGAGLCLILILVFVSLRHGLNPLKGLKAGMESMAAGQLETRVPERGHGELAELARGFNRMAARVQNDAEARRRLLSDVSHELRTPLSRLKLGLEFVEDGKAKASMADDLRELEAMVAGLLERERLAGAHSGLKKEAFDLAQLCREMAERETPQARELKLELPESLPISADRERLRDLLRNLLGNAFRHGGDPVTLGLALEADGKSALIWIEDHGVGVPEESRERIFEPFYREDRSRSRDSGGLGLGLSLSRALVEAHGGSLKMAGPTRFEARLPLGEANGA